MPFPPDPVFPRAIDSNRTLFLVHNTTETRLSTENEAWAEEIEIVPVNFDQDEIWSDNGFATIEGELLYYDAVSKDVNGKVNKLRKCARNLGGNRTRYNPSGTWIRSFVIAEHHNQLVDATLAVENFVGYNFDPRPATLDWRIRNLQGLATVADDYNCPDVNFTFNIIDSNPQTGILTRYLIQVQSNGSLPTSNFRLDFGDGTFTTTSLSGTHRYSIGAKIDPVLTITNNNCQYIQTPSNRDNSSVINEFTEVPFEIPLPPTPIIPPINQISLVCTEPELQLPPLITPCTTFDASIPSLIVGPDINLVSAVTITGPDNPINITTSVVSFVGAPNIPEVIVFDNVPIIPPTISIIGNIPSTIIIEQPSSAIAFALDFESMPMLGIDWGIAPTMRVEMVHAKPVTKSFTAKNEFGPEFSDVFKNETTIEYEAVSIPKVITIEPPSKEDMTVRLDTVAIKDTFVEINQMMKETVKSFVAPLKEIISEFSNQTIKLESPKSIKLDSPESIKLEVPLEFPKILIDTDNVSIPVTGIPEFLSVKFPDKMPEIPLVYKGDPIELKLVMDDMIISKENGKTNCVMIVPCNR